MLFLSRLKSLPIQKQVQNRTCKFQLCARASIGHYRQYCPPVAKAKKQKVPQVSIKQRAAEEQSGSGVVNLNHWRSGQRDLRWYWGEKGATEERRHNWLDADQSFNIDSIADGAARVLSTADPAGKCRATHQMWRALVEQNLPVGHSIPPTQPARPELPEIVASREIPKAKESGLPLNVYMLLNLAHVELNAIDIACDTVARFSNVNLPREFYIDFAHVAEDESRHFGWCTQRLNELGYSYGDMVAHSLLWDGAEASSGDVMARLVIGPCSQEARGLDAGPRLVERMISIGDSRSAAIVHQISKEELAHVAVGAFWFRELCTATGSSLSSTFQSWLNELCPDMLAGNFNHTARKNAGLEQEWYDKSLWAQNSNQDMISEKCNTLPSLSNTQYERLRERLTDMLASESEIASLAQSRSKLQDKLFAS